MRNYLFDLRVLTMARNLSSDISSSGHFSLLLTFEFPLLFDSEIFKLALFRHRLNALCGDSGFCLLPFQSSETSTSFSPVWNKKKNKNRFNLRQKKKVVGESLIANYCMFFIYFNLISWQLCLLVGNAISASVDASVINKFPVFGERTSCLICDWFVLRWGLYKKKFFF